MIDTSNSEKVIVGTCLMFDTQIPDVRRQIHQDMIRDPKTRYVYEHINRVYDGPEPFSVSLVIASMSTSGQLEQVGGEPFVMGLMNQADTMQVSQSCRVVVESWSDTETDAVIRRLQADRAKRGTWSGLRNKLLNDVQTVMSRARAWDAKLDLINQLTFSSDSPPPPPSVVISMGGSTIASSGNLILLTGEEKSGKSGVVGAIISGSMGSGPDVTMGMDILPNRSGHGLIHIDTEQSKYDHYQDCMAILKRAGVQKEPHWFRSVGMKGINPSTKLEYMEIAIADSFRKFGGIYAVFIDGAADMVKSVNDEEESNEITERLEHIATKYSCPVFTILHYNPNSKKTRGTLGSNMRRKIESSIEVTKDWDSGVSTVRFEYTRNASNLRPIEFRFSREHGYHVSLNTLRASLDRPFNLGSGI